MKYFPKSAICMMCLSIFCSALFGISADPPSGYYDSAIGLSGTALRNALHEIIDDHQRLIYTDETRPVLAAADEDSSNSSNILDVYKNASYAKTDTTSWNQEHAWPKSYGFPDDVSCNYPYTDCHHLFACDASYNSTRGNIPYDFCVSDCTAYPALPLESGMANYRSGSGNTGAWEVWPGRRGDVARALLYLDVRYEGGTHGISGCAEPDLILTNDRENIVTTDTNVSIAYMGILDTLLQWHQMDPVDDKERYRNDVVYQNQGNRNPFIDHPEWVAEIWNSSPTPTPTSTSTSTPTPTPTPTPIIGISPGDIVINEIDYDDPGVDTESFIELKNVSFNTIDLSHIQVIGFNGATSETYFTFTPQSEDLHSGQYHVLGTQNDSSDVSVDIDETMSGVSGIQNGPDGIYIRLSSDPDTIIDSVSYESELMHPAGSTDTGNAGTDIPDSGFYSLSRLPDGADANNNSVDFVFKEATPGESNGNAPTPTPIIVISPGDIVINEIDYNDPGIDSESFIELKNVSSNTIDLSCIQVIGFNGATSETYFTFTPQSKDLHSGQYHVLGTQNDSSDVSVYIDETMSGVLSIQNGPDGVYIRLSSPPYTIIDSVSYQSDLVHPAGSTDTGNAGTDSPDTSFYSLSRLPDGADANNNSVDFVLKEATPGVSNGNAPTPTPTPTPQYSGFIIH
ncbi:endonuclease [Candidatus Sumerlaeota bacterium]|nr:endonuclease [Candidatus Sumerlaeota bacterium]